MQRFGQVIGVKPEKVAEYSELHANVWPEILAKIEECNIHNYSIFLLNDDTLFAYFEYHGNAFEADMGKMAADPKTQEWWDVCMPMQAPLENRAEGEWWHTLTEVFHCD
ncbi:MAG: L-rhamnose mutarotase [Chloroflexi bacterium]|nr:L-rhamnose mutarotase [Chloroflexota bacterium]